MNMPIISLQLQGMKHTIHAALANEHAAMDKAVQEALDRLCSEENVARIVHEEARRQIEATLKEEVQNFFRWSNAGRLAIREAVQERLDQLFPVSGGAPE